MRSFSWPFARTSLLLVFLLLPFAYSQEPGFNPFIVPKKNQTVAAGSTFTIAWEPTPKFGPKISIQLLVGTTSLDLEDGPVLVSNISPNVGRFAWKIPTDLEQWDLYGLILSLDSDPLIFQYAYPFKITFDGIPKATKSATSTSSSLSGSTSQTTTPKPGEATASLSSLPSTTVLNEAVATGLPIASSSPVASSGIGNASESTGATGTSNAKKRKIAIAVGATLSGMIVFGMATWLLFLYTRTKYQRASLKQRGGAGDGRPGSGEGTLLAVELVDVIVLSEDEKRELQNKRRAAQLEAAKVKFAGDSVELDTRRKEAKEVHELG